jgi:hypothetical protein
MLPAEVEVTHFYGMLNINRAGNGNGDILSEKHHLTQSL